MHDLSPHLEPTRSAVTRTAPRDELSAPAPAQPLFARRTVDAAAKTMLCCAGVHILILTAYVVTSGDARAVNMFTVLDAQRLWPALASLPAAPWWSFAALLALYGVVYGTLTRGGHVARHSMRPPAQGHGKELWRVVTRLGSPSATAAFVAPGFARSVAANGSPAPEAQAVPDPRSFVGTLFQFQPSLRDGLLMLAGGLALHMAALAGIERFVQSFPPVPDVLHMSLPYVDFGPPGELVYAAFLVTIIAVLMKRQPRTAPGILFLLGVFYGLRGLFLFLLPIGIPPTAPPLEARFVFWPFAGHAYFPGGHTGMMTVLSLSVISRSWRRAFLVATFAFAFGTLLSRTHYSADALGGWCIGYAIVLWGRRHVVMRPASYSSSQGTAWSSTARREQEA